MEGRHLNLTVWTEQELCQAQSEIDQTLSLIFKVKSAPATLVYEKRIAKGMAKAWKQAMKDTLTKPLRQLLSRKPTPARITNFMKRLGVGMKDPLTPKQAEFIGKNLTSIYKKAKALAAKEAKFKFTFDKPDRVAIDALNRHQKFWIGNLFDEHLGERISAVSRDVLLERGYSVEEAGRELEQALRREFSLTPGGVTRFAEAIPSRYAGNTDLYFKQVASTAAHTARSFATVQAFSEAGVTRYELINPNDERTGKICQHMSGQIFTVADATRQMRRMLNAETPEEIKEAAPWLSAAKLDDGLKGAKPGSAEATRNLRALGASVLPPFHPLCRTEAVVID